MNKEFTTPEIKVIKLEFEDIILVSGLFPEEGMEEGGAGSGGSTGY